MPPLKDGCYVIGKYMESLNDIRNGNTYVLITKEDGVVYKRVYKEDNELTLQSDNKSYSPYKVNAADVLEVWEFVCNLNISDTKEEELNLDSIMNMLRGMKVEIDGIRKVN
jgi:hypothetical protein